jgi:hypothetical protein
MPSLTYYRKPAIVLRYRWNDMRDRVNGKPMRTGMDRSVAKNCPWKGMEIADRSEFIAWGLNDPEFLRLFDLWAADGFARRSAPTAHRIDRTRGYTLDNIQFVSHAEKSRKHLAQGKKTRAAKKVTKAAA